MCKTEKLPDWTPQPLLIFWFAARNLKHKILCILIKILLPWIPNPFLLRSPLLTVGTSARLLPRWASLAWPTLWFSSSRRLWVSTFLVFLLLWFFMSLRPLILQWNIRGFRANSHWLRSSPELMAPIICLQETFLSSGSPSFLPGMTLYRADRDSRGGGLLTAVHSSLPSYRLSFPPCPLQDFEALGVSVHANGKKFNIINIYSPKGSFPEVWLSDIISNSDSPVILLGDFNTNVLPRSPPFSPRAIQLLDWLQNQDLCLLNSTSPTCSHYINSTSLIDLCITTPRMYNSFKFYVHPDSFDSDHHPIIYLSTLNWKVSACPCRMPDWKKAANKLKNTPNLPSNSYEDFENACSSAISETSFTPKKGSRPRRPWWDATCRHLLALKRKQLRLARSLCSRVEWLKYKLTSARLRRYIKSAARRYWDSVCVSSCSNNHIYKILKRLANRNCSPGDNILRNPEPLTSIQAQANAFLNYFSRNDPGLPIPYDLSEGDPELDSPLTLAELQHALCRTRPTSPGADGIPANLFKQLSISHLNSLLSTFNNSFDSGSLPQSWKIATIIPVCKPGKPTHLPSSYRPIALTSVGCKIFERIILRRLLSWCGCRNLFNPEHHGFIPSRDCSTALGTLLHDVTLARKTNHFIAAVCLDIKAAYDSVNIDILISKLATLGIRGKVGRWIEKFAKGREIQIRWKNFITQKAPCYQGVPQGSVLSPLLFLLYTLDIVEVLEEGVRMIIYADDIVVYASGKDDERTRQKLQSSLSKINTWCLANCLSLEPAKCSAINFSRRRDPGVPVKLLGSEIPWKQTIKILGVWFSRNLCFTPHFKYLKVKVLKKLNYLRAVTNRSQGVTSHHMLSLVKAILGSSLEYGAPLFYDSPPSALRLLETCLHAGIRLATGLPMWTPIPVLLREACVSSVTSRLKLSTKKFLVRLLAASPGSRLGEAVRSNLISPDSSWKWGSTLQEVQLLLGSSLINTLPFVWPPLPCLQQAEIITHELSFQDPLLPGSAVAPAWSWWLSSLPTCTIFATDASKDLQKTSVAAVDYYSDLACAALVPHSNSVFTAEALAIHLALTSLPISNPKVIILSDSLSVLKATQQWDFKSPKVIFLLLSDIHRLISRGFSISLVWCPGHRGIPPNEAADRLAKSGPFRCSSLPWIAPEDIRSLIHKDWLVEVEYHWINSDYAPSYPHLQQIRPKMNWISSRKIDVILARWRSRTILTCNRLYRMNMCFSPLCNFCYDIETADHILLHCPRLDGPRHVLFTNLGISPPFSYSNVLSVAFSSSRSLSFLISFSKRAFPALT